MGEEIFTKEQMGRLVDVGQENGRRVIVCDLHHMSRREALRFVKNVIALTSRWVESVELRVITGYNSGTVLRDMVQTEFFSYRVSKVEENIWNEGQTSMYIESLYAAA